MTSTSQGVVFLWAIAMMSLASMPSTEGHAHRWLLEDPVRISCDDADDHYIEAICEDAERQFRIDDDDLYVQMSNGDITVFAIGLNNNNNVGDDDDDDRYFVDDTPLVIYKGPAVEDPPPPVEDPEPVDPQIAAPEPAPVSTPLPHAESTEDPEDTEPAAEALPPPSDPEPHPPLSHDEGQPDLVSAHEMMNTDGFNVPTVVYIPGVGEVEIDPSKEMTESQPFKPVAPPRRDEYEVAGEEGSHQPPTTMDDGEAAPDSEMPSAEAPTETIEVETDDDEERDVVQNTEALDGLPQQVGTESADYSHPIVGVVPEEPAPVDANGLAGDVQPESPRHGSKRQHGTKKGTKAPVEEACNSLPDEIAQHPNLVAMSLALKRTRIDEYIRGMEQSITIFAPPDVAFEKLANKKGMTVLELIQDVEFMEKVLKLHIVKDFVRGADLVNSQTLQTALPGTSLLISTNNDSIFVVPPGGEAGIIQLVDIDACNAVMHIIDTVLMPIDDLQITMAAAG